MADTDTDQLKAALAEVKALRKQVKQLREDVDNLTVKFVPLIHRLRQIIFDA